ncbi:MAG: hypothetical protein K0B10_11125 [Vicingaceae bacterium]|nr:hypothetical protein [Vicingaceae bacterium]
MLVSFFTAKKKKNANLLSSRQYIYRQAIVNQCTSDDYRFVFYTTTLGLWKAQAHWYLTWVGRYFSTFILSLHPLLIKSTLLYKVVPVVLIFFSIHSIYRFINTLIKTKTVALFLALYVLFYYLIGMPSLVQGIYWLPGAITYQLPNILLLYLITNFIKEFFHHEVTNYNPIINAALIVAIIGSNETSMVQVVVFIAMVFVIYFFKYKEINKTLAGYLIVSICCFSIVYFAPGNEYRYESFMGVENHQFLETILNSFKQASIQSYTWIFSFPTLLLSILLYLTFKRFNSNKNKISLQHFLWIFLMGFLLLSVGYSTGFWSMGAIAPERTINVIFWLFIIVFVLLLFFLSNIEFYKIQTTINKHYYKLAFVLLISSFISVFSNTNFSNVMQDLQTKKAYQYNMAFNQRDELLFSSLKDTCIVSNLSAYPSSIFTREFSIENDSIIAHYYNKKAIKLNFQPPNYAETYYFNLDNDTTKLLSNLNTLTTEAYKSAPNSSKITVESPYSALFSKKITSKKVVNFSGLYVKTDFLSPNKELGFTIVFNITDEQNNTIYYKGEDYIISNNSYSWQKADALFYLEKKLINKNYTYTVYIWNNSNSSIYIDDLVISFF